MDWTGTIITLLILGLVGWLVSPPLGRGRHGRLQANDHGPDNLSSP